MARNIVQNNLSPAISKSDFIKLQLDQAIDTFKTQLSLSVQIITILLIANVTVVGFAISNKIAGIFFLGFIFPCVLLFVLIRMSRMMKPLLYTAIHLEQKYGGGDTDWVVSTFIGTVINQEYLDKLKEISSDSDPLKRANNIRKLKSPFMSNIKSPALLTLILLAFLQLIFPFILILFFSWHLL